MAKSARGRRSLASCHTQYREGEGRPEPPRRIVTIRHNPSELGELLEIKEEGLDCGRGEPERELLEKEREARGGEAELFGSIEETSSEVRGKHERASKGRRRRGAGEIARGEGERELD
jgi:hypothetical protein